MSDTGGVSIAPADGKQLWSYHWPTQDRILQPGFTDNNDILFTGGMDDGMRRVTVSNVSGRWNFKQQWKTDGLAPYFNDFVVHNGYAYGFNGRSLACIDLKDGKRMWQGGRFGGQLILLADQDVLLLLSEKGEVALVSATPDTYRVLAEMLAIKGKTWNHPVLAGDILLVRNTSEMAAFHMARF
jgi:outer membrane protein assembly factor BamB